LTLVTIGLCVKNCEETVKDTMQSILDQDFPCMLMELIVVDDGCVDNTLSIIDDALSEYNVKKKLFCNYGKGLSSARQLVVDNASGKYILWVDGDITMKKDYVRKLFEFMEKTPLAGCSRGKWGKYLGKNLVATLENMKILYFDFEGTQRTSRLLGTAGTIQRVDAIKMVGGFDKNISGAGEDVDLEAKMMDIGWELYICNTTFFHKEKTSWKGLWSQYFWWGYGAHYVFHRHKNIGRLWTMIPAVAFVTGAFHSVKAYQLTQRKVALLLPLQYAFKRVAWCLGFINAHFDNYELH